MCFEYLAFSDHHSGMLLGPFNMEKVLYLRLLHIAYCENCHCISLIALILLVLHSPGLEPLAHGGGGLVAALPRLELLPAAAAAPQQPRHPCSVQPGHVRAPQHSPSPHLPRAQCARSPRSSCWTWRGCSRPAAPVSGARCVPSLTLSRSIRGLSTLMRSVQPGW